MIEPDESRMPEAREPHELPHMLEQAASDLSASLRAVQVRLMPNGGYVRLVPAHLWDQVIKDLTALDGVLAEIEAQEAS